MKRCQVLSLTSSRQLGVVERQVRLPERHPGIVIGGGGGFDVGAGSWGYSLAN
jgi:hypothetical protein